MIKKSIAILLVLLMLISSTNVFATGVYTKFNTKGLENAPNYTYDVFDKTWGFLGYYENYDNPNSIYDIVLSVYAGNENGPSQIQFVVYEFIGNVQADHYGSTIDLLLDNNRYSIKLNKGRTLLGPNDSEFLQDLINAKSMTFRINFNDAEKSPTITVTTKELADLKKAAKYILEYDMLHFITDTENTKKFNEKYPITKE